MTSIDPRKHKAPFLKSRVTGDGTRSLGQSRGQLGSQVHSLVGSAPGSLQVDSIPSLVATLGLLLAPRLV